MDKATPRPVRVSDVVEKVQVPLLDLSSQRVEYEGKVSYVLSVMVVLSIFHCLYALQKKIPSSCG